MKAIPTLRMKALAAFALFACLAAHGNLEASVLVNASFDDGYSVGTINGQSGSSDTGQAGTWTVNAGFESKASIVAANSKLNYSVSGGGTINAGPNALRVNYVTSDGSLTNSILANRALSSSISNQNIFMGMVFLRTGDNNLNSGMYMEFFAADSALPTGTVPGIGVYKGYLEAGSNAATGAGQPPFGAVEGGPLFSAYPTGANFLVAEYIWDSSANAYTSVNFWLNPNVDGSSSASHVSYSLANNLSSISYIGIKAVNVSSNNSYQFDSFKIATAWQDIVPVPEPSVSALIPLAGGVLGLLALRGRRQPKP